MTTAIQVVNLCKRFDRFEAVADISFEVPRGAVFGLLGSNGSGKSTTVKMLSGQLPPTSGDAILGGASILTEPLRVKQRLGVLPEGDTLFAELSLLDHLRFEGRVRGLERALLEARAESLLRFFDLWDKRHTLAGNGSTGMKKKLGVSLALIHRPEVVILDEPFEGLDPVAASNLKRLLVALSAAGVTILITSHVLTLLEGLLDQAALIQHGRLLSVTNIADLKTQKRDLSALYLDAFGSGGEGVDGLEWLL